MNTTCICVCIKRYSVKPLAIEDSPTFNLVETDYLCTDGYSIGRKFEIEKSNLDPAFEPIKNLSFDDCYTVGECRAELSTRIPGGVDTELVYETDFSAVERYRLGFITDRNEIFTSPKFVIEARHEAEAIAIAALRIGVDYEEVKDILYGKYDQGDLDKMKDHLAEYILRKHQDKGLTTKELNKFVAIKVID